MQAKRNILLGSVFIMSLIIGWGVTKLVIPSEEQSSTAKKPSPVENPSPVDNPSAVKIPSTAKKPSPVENPSPVDNPSAVKIPSPVDNPPTAKTPSPVETPPPAKTLSTEEEKKPVGASAGEFQVLLLNLNDNSLLGGKNPKVAKNVSLTVRGMHDDEPTPGDIQAVRDKISNRIWVSARVISVGHDEKGRVNSAVIQPVYN